MRSPSVRNPCHAAIAYYCLELSFSSWQLRRAVRAGQALRPASKERMVGPACQQESYALLVLLTVSSAGAGVGTGRQVSKCVKTCLCTS